MNLQISYSKTYSSKKDEELWTDFKSGDKDAFSRIYYKNAQPLLDYALKITSDKKLIEDCMQEMFLDLWNNRAGLNEVKMIRNYLFTTLRRRITKSLKTQSRFFSSDAGYIASGFELPLEGTMILEQEDLEKKEKLNKAIITLSPLQKEIIYLKYYSDFSFEEISKILRSDKKVVYNALSKAMINLRKVLICMMLFFM